MIECGMWNVKDIYTVRSKMLHAIEYNARGSGAKSPIIKFFSVTLCHSVV